MLGFITKKQHVASRKDDAETIAALEAEVAEYRGDLTRALEARDNWRETARAWEAKFKKAITDLEAATRRAIANEADAEKFRAKARADAERKKSQRADKCRSRWGARLYRIVADDLRAALHEEDKVDG